MSAVEPPDNRLAERDSDGQPKHVHLIGLFGGVHDGRWRLYLSGRLDCYAEFPADAVRASPQIHAGGPVPGFESTAVVLARGTPVTFTWSETLTANDQLDLDVRMELAQGHSMRRLINARTMSPTTKLCPS